MEARVDVRKLQILNDRINQTIDALSQVRLSVHGLAHTGVPPTMFQPFGMIPPTPGYPTPVCGPAAGAADSLRRDPADPGTDRPFAHAVYAVRESALQRSDALDGRSAPLDPGSAGAEAPRDEALDPIRIRRPSPSSGSSSG